MSVRLKGKVAIVTGAASVGPGLGNGQAIAKTFAREGASVVLVNRSLEHAQGLAAEIDAEGGSCMAVAADVTVSTDAARIVQEAVSHFGRLDILVNNVGAGAAGTVVDVEEEAWARALDGNLLSAMLCSKHAIPRLRESGGGAVINVSTVAAVRGFRREGSGFAAYSASKAAVVGLTTATAADHAADGIRVNCLLVGMVNTPHVAHLGEEHRAKRAAAVPLPLEGTAQDVAWAAVYLASDEARWVTGVSLPVDGGQLAISDFPR